MIYVFYFFTEQLINIKRSCRREMVDKNIVRFSYKYLKKKIIYIFIYMYIFINRHAVFSFIRKKLLLGFFLQYLPKYIIFHNKKKKFVLLTFRLYPIKAYFFFERVGVPLLIEYILS